MNQVPLSHLLKIGADALNTTAQTLSGAVNELKSALSNKQNTLTFDDTPTASSANPVKSGGVCTALGGKVNIAQGAVNEGKILQVDSDGNLELTDLNTTLDALTDTAISSPVDKQVLMYDAVAQKWENTTINTNIHQFVQHIVFGSEFYGQTLNIIKDGIALPGITLDSTGDLTLYFTEAGTYVFSATATYNYTFTHTVKYTYYRQYDEFELEGKAPMYAFESCTDEQLTAMLRSYYGGAYDAADIATLKATYFPVGAKRTIHLSQMAAADGVTDAHFDALGADYAFTIIDHEHDTLETPINGKTKAFLTLQQDRILYRNTTDSTYSSSYPAVADGGGYMNASDTNVGGWKECKRRAWCNNTYFNALPEAIRNLVKTVSKQSSKGNQLNDIDVTQDKTFLLSEIEIFGAIAYSKSGEGSQYKYYETATNRYKKPSYSSYASAYWWERSPYGGNASFFCNVDKNGTAGYNVAVTALGLAPAFCI